MFGWIYTREADLNMSEIIFGFDLGTGSIGEAVKKENEIIHANSFLLDQDVASIKDQSKRRRIYRTIVARKNREKWLDRVWSDCGLSGKLKGRRHIKKGKDFEVIKGDLKLEKEFGSKNGPVYTSCLLRIHLLQGKKLENWQIYKALRSSFQRRGYDSHVPWKTGNRKENKHYEEAMNSFQKELKEMSSNEKYHYPCYYDAWKMCLWDPNTNQISVKQEHKAQRSRGYVASREIVEKEIYHLLVQASEQVPELKGKEGYILYGDAGQNFKDIYEEGNKDQLEEMRYVYEKKHKGILAQKRPRFDNRILSKCCMIPRYNVCRSKELLAIEATYLLKLKNLVYENSEYKQEKLHLEDIKQLYHQAKEKLKKKIQKNQDEKTLIR